ncbi:hypothetical protein [uncultured Traorella sp.]|uniref:hypothetical protein n=1 Tax=uncultured Traorella sp. TaxID=1929048 RepID=UPI0025F2860F|nr:hypothetical protein [uncultured Traorella sp.]
MKFFKKKPKPDVMGFICCETSLNRSHYIVDQYHDEKLYYPTYLYSTAMIFYNLEKKYSKELIEQIRRHCDRFFLKKNKAYSEEQILSDRNKVMHSVMNHQHIEDYLTLTGLKDENGELADLLDEWMNANLLLSEDIKSM